MEAPGRAFARALLEAENAPPWPACKRGDHEPDPELPGFCAWCGRPYAGNAIAASRSAAARNADE